MISVINEILSKDEAWALAELCKRIGWTDVRQLAVGDDEADLMQAALIKIAKELSLEGYSPR